ncbi:MAG: NfeD family protein [Verrucomicrobia bacterium]|nr:NfeD family protein [Verrucomicrobiota bacterium]
MSKWLPLFFIVYLATGLLLIPLAKRHPKYFGPAKELTDYSLVLSFLWPVVLILGLFLPSLTLEQKLDAVSNGDGESETWPIGGEALCLCDLRPCGKIEVNGQSYDATCLENFIPKGRMVKVLKKQGYNFIVEEIDK